MRKRLSGPFTISGASGSGGIETAILDGVGSFGAPYTSLWSPGNGNVTKIVPPPSGTQRWKALSVSVTAYLGFSVVGTAFGTAYKGPIYGKLGKIIAGILLDEQIGTYGTITRFPGVPPDNSMIADLWDPATDPMPPSFADTNLQIINPITGVQYTPIAATVSPPVPLDITPQSTLAVGIWMTPSLIGGGTTGFSLIGLQVFQPQWQLVYDDGG